MDTRVTNHGYRDGKATSLPGGPAGRHRRPRRRPWCAPGPVRVRQPADAAGRTEVHAQADRRLLAVVPGVERRGRRARDPRSSTSS